MNSLKAIIRCNSVVTNFNSRLLSTTAVRYYPGDEYGRGAGKGGGAGGSVREAGGSFGKMEAAREEEYFRKLQNKQLHALKGKLEDEVSHHEAEIKRLHEDIEKHKKRCKELKSTLSDTEKPL